MQLWLCACTLAREWHTDLLPTWALLWNLFLVPSDNCNIQAHRAWLHSGACEWCWGLFTYLLTHKRNPAPAKSGSISPSPISPDPKHLSSSSQPWETLSYFMAIKWNKASGLFFNSSLLPALGLPNFPHKVHVREAFYLWLSSALTCTIWIESSSCCSLVRHVQGMGGISYLKDLLRRLKGGVWEADKLSGNGHGDVMPDLSAMPFY